MADIPQRLARKSKSIANMSLLQGFQRPKWLTWFRQKYWAYEVFALLGSLILFLILVALLKAFDQKDYQAWQFGITLNAMVSLLVALMGPVLVMPVQSCLGQLKWNRFRRHGGDLREFDLHDQASRTAWGAAKLIIKKPKQPHGLFAAAITIAIVAIAPLVQQIIKIEVAKLPPTDATVQVAYSYIEKDDPALPLPQLTQFSVYTALYQLYSGGFPVYPTVDAVENATFGRYASLGLRSECQDITDKLTRKDIKPSTSKNSFFKMASFEMALPNNHTFQGYLNPVNNVPGASWSIPTFSIKSENDPIYFKDRGNIVVDWTAIYVPPLKVDSPHDVQPVAWECMIQFAGWPLSSYSTAGKANPGPFVEYFSQPLVVDNSEAAQKASPFNTHLARVRGRPPANAGSDASLTCLNMTVPTEEGQTQELSTCYRQTSRLSSFLGSIFDGVITTSATADKIIANSSSNVGTEVQVAKADAVVAIAAVIGGPPATSEQGFNISGLMNATANSLTNNFRTASTDADRQLHKGKARKELLVYHIVWAWAGVPVILIVMVTGLLIWTVLDTRRKNLPVWGTSCLADLVHGLDDTTRNTMMPIDEVEQMERTSERIHVFLRPSDKVLAATEALSGTSVEFKSRKSDVQTPSRSLFGHSHPYQQI